MYLEILEAMEEFKKNKKALFLCNTRHAYTNVKNSEGRSFWNTASLFQQRNSGKFISVRINNLTLSLENKVPAHAAKGKSTDGLSESVYKWVKMDQGHWDEAFDSNHNKQVAIPLHHSLFGRTRYIGNHMLDCAAGTTIADTYDALIFLAPLNKLHFSAQFSVIYTPAFKPELERRLLLLKGDGYNAYLKENKALNFDDYYKKIQQVIPISINNYLQE